MNFEHAYRALIKEENLAAIKAKLLADNYYTAAILEATTIKMDGDLPYLSCPIKFFEGWEQTPGMLDSTFVDFGDLLPEWDGYFYFSILFIADETDYLFGRFMPYPAVLAHELLHLKQMLRLITADPKYITRAQKYCFDATKIYDLRHGMRYEIEKIFNLEVEAHVLDWDLGIRHLVSFNANEEAKAVEYFDKNMYIQHSIAMYLCLVMMRFTQKFPSKKNDIKPIITALMNEYGKPIFGTVPLIGMSKAFMEYTKRGEDPELVQSVGFIGNESHEFDDLKKLLKKM